MEREVIDAGALIVGGGPAGLACAIRLAQRIAQDGEQAPIEAEELFLLEKGEALGMHSLSGAVVDLGALASLFPDKDLFAEIPGIQRVDGEHLEYLSQSGSRAFPWVPPELDNHGNAVISLGQLVRWMGEQAEELGVCLFTGFAAAEPVFDGDALRGVITGARGVDRHGQPKNNFENGYEIRAPVSVLAEGSRGSVSKTVIDHFNLDAGRNPQSYAIGVKELWKVPEGRVKPGDVYHFMGYPTASNTYGGGWLYGVGDNRVSVGLINGLQYIDPRLDPHQSLQAFKTHPRIQAFLEDGELLRYGAKTIPVGGLWAIPKTYFNGGLLVGDSGGFFNSKRLKGVHAAIQSGMLAADAVYEALKQGSATESVLMGYDEKFRASDLYAELWAARNHHQAMERGLLKGSIHYLLQKFSGGRGLYARYPSVAGYSSYLQGGEPVRAEKELSVVQLKLDSVYHSGVRHEEDQPVHLQVADTAICVERCTVEYGNPCTHFCPASVYEMVGEGDQRGLKINASNCIHCKTCDIMDPYRNINWLTPEGGGGPRYESM